MDPVPDGAPHGPSRRGRFGDGVRAKRLVGNVALVSHPGRKEGEESAARFWFDDWSVRGPAVARDDASSVGPIVSSQYTVSRGRGAATSQAPGRS